MSKDIKNIFQGDMFADDNDKWSLTVGGSLSKGLSGESNYEAYPSGSRPDSSDSEEGFIMHGDSSSQQRSIENMSSSSKSGEIKEESSPQRAPCERVLPSIYDDDAQSGSPGNVRLEDKNLAFNSFNKGLISANSDRSPPPSKSNTESKDKKLQSLSPLDKDKRRRSGSKEARQRSSSREGRSKKSSERRSRDRQSSSEEKKHRKSRSCSREQRSRSHSREHRSRSHSRERRPRDNRRRSRSRDRNRRNEQSYRRRSRSRSYDRHRRADRYRNLNSYRHHRRRHYRSRSRSRDRSRESNSRKFGSVGGSSGTPMTPQMALQQTMAAMSAKAQALTGIALPKYYNPAAVNPLKYAEQVQKRKLLWQTKEKVEEQSKNSVWDKLTFAQDQDGKMTAKFRKLMGIKSDGPAEADDKESVLQKQEVLFRDLDQQYEMARMTTHTQRGVGLGYSQQQPIYPAVSK